MLRRDEAQGKSEVLICADAATEILLVDLFEIGFDLALGFAANTKAAVGRLFRRGFRLFLFSSFGSMRISSFFGGGT
jgi:hypothetical protein